MDPPRTVGLGLNPSSLSPRVPDTVLSTAPASPSDESAVLRPTNEIMNTSTVKQSLAPHSTVASLSFGPATQQTVTTVTTTTTVSLPPLIIKPPRNLSERDPKQYPLAFSPTPQNFKRFCFDVNNQPTVFREAEDAQETARQHQQLLEQIDRHHGVVRQEHRDTSYSTPVTRISKPLFMSRPQQILKRTASPPSLAEAVEIASLQRKSKKPRSHLHRTYSEASEVPTINETAALTGHLDIGNPSPVTPGTDAVGAGQRSGHPTSIRGDLKSAGQQTQSRLRRSSNQSVEMPDADSHEEEESQPGPPFYNKSLKRRHGETGGPSGPAQEAEQALRAGSPPPGLASLEQDPYRIRPSFSSFLTSSQQDASLPSPSLSPITAAANMASRQNAFDSSFAEHNVEKQGENLDLDAVDLDKSRLHGSLGLQPYDDKAADLPPPFDSSAASRQHVGPLPGPTIMDIPTMVDAFDNMPEAMQSYLMYQFLRRCTKQTLQMVANVVNPALKCDPFSILPPELALNITCFLDAQSMCRAAQVSKRWRRLINSNEKAWKDLLERDEFILPEGEIGRAVREGWGWQHSGEEGFEEDLSTASRITPEPTGTANTSDDEVMGSSSLGSRIPKRKIKPSGPKKANRRPAPSNAKPATTLQMKAKLVKLLESARGASAYAAIAAQAVPHPTVGLDSLRNMHLFKSIYQRHYLIRKAWMTESSRPRHLAFRAHHRHVVTCLLFDSDKILTGSDDNKINVYDTKTGALRTRLEGHEGGVWALQYEGNTLVSGSTDRSVRVWDIDAGTCLQVFQGHTSTVRCLVILKPTQIGTESDGTPIMMPKEPLVITGSRDSTLRVWKLPGPDDPELFQAGPPANDRDNPYFLRTLTGHHNSVRAIAAHGDTLVSGSYDCTVRVWKISTGALVYRLAGHTQKVYSVVLDHARNRCISGSMDHLVKVWDLNTGETLYTLEGHTSLVGLLDLSHDHLVSAAADSTLRIWDPQHGSCKATLSAHRGAITCFQHDGQKVISGSDCTLKMWNVKNGAYVRDLLTDLSGVWQVRFDERRCVAAVQRNSLTYIEVLDFGAARDGVPAADRGRRIVVDQRGREIEDVDSPAADAEMVNVATG